MLAICCLNMLHMPPWNRMSILSNIFAFWASFSKRWQCGLLFVLQFFKHIWNCILFPSVFSLRPTFHLKLSRLNYSQMAFLFSFNRDVYTVGVEELPVIFILLSSLVTHTKKFSMSSLIHILLFLSYRFKVLKEFWMEPEVLNGMITVPSYITNFQRSEI